MNRDDIIRMAREAGFEIERVVAVYPDGSRTVTVAPMKELERFAALVAAATLEGLKGTHTCSQLCQRPACVETRKAVAAERNAIAEMFEQPEWWWLYGHPSIAAAIRNRG